MADHPQRPDETRSADAEWNRDARGETEAERLDRNLGELLQELRVAETGVQILFAFLLTIPFQQRFVKLTSFERDIYFGSLVATALSSIFFIAPVAYHRWVFRHHDKRQLVYTSNVMALLGIACLAVAMTGILFLITDFLFGAVAASIVAALIAIFIGGLWYALPLVRRHQHDDGQPTS